MKPQPFTAVLTAAAALIDSGWTTGAYARDAMGADCLSTEAAARSWCADGAIRAAACRLSLPHAIVDDSTRRVLAHLGLELSSDPGGDLVLWNDGRGQTAAAVAAAMRAAAREE